MTTGYYKSSDPNALELVVEGPEHLDLLWADLFVTGSPDPILRIMARSTGRIA